MYKKMLVCCSAIILSIILSTSMAFAATVRLGTIRADNVNVREKASTDSDIIGTLDADDSVTITGSKGSFFKIKFKGKTGYVSDEFVSVSSSKTGTVNAKNVTIREKASTKSDKVGSLQRGDKVSVYGERDGFYRVASSEGAGYVSKEFIDMGSSKKSTADSEETKTEPKEEARSESTSVRIETGGGEYSEDELYLVALLIYMEHRNASAEGYDAMASVVYNRLKSKRFPDTIEGIVFQENQFSVVDDREDFFTHKPNSGAQKGVQRVFVDGILTLPPDVMYFKSARLSKSWGSRTYYGTIDGHMYYS